MKLTICLITKGRKEYLEDALKSYEKFLDVDNVDVILIDNGSDLLSKQILLDWKLKCSKKVSYFRIETNNPSGFTAFWDIIESSSPDWILNPGDDDILVFDDIHWSRDMEKAWLEIKQDIRVKYTIDLFFIGLVFLKKDFLEKQDFVVHF